MTHDAVAFPADSDLSLRAVVVAPPLQRDTGDWAFPVAAAGSARITLGEVRVTAELMERSRFREHDVWRIDGGIDFARIPGAALDIDIAPGLFVLHAHSAQRIAPAPMEPFEDPGPTLSQDGGSRIPQVCSCRSRSRS